MAGHSSVPLVAALLSALLLAGPASGHADYEHPLLTVRDRQGGSLTVVQHYMDGIVGVDPVKLVVYDPNGAVLAETPYCRDVLVYQEADGTIHVFGVGWFSVLFGEAWTLRDGELVPTRAAASFGYALAAALRTHWLGYGFSVPLCCAGAGALLQRTRAMRDHRRAGRGKLSILWSRLGFLWLLLLFLYGHLSVPLIVVLAGLGLLPFLAWRGAFRWSRAGGA
jgi:hypothetical protein